MQKLDLSSPQVATNQIISSPEQLLRRIGKPRDALKTAYDDLPRWQIEFCEEQCKLWKFTSERCHARRENNVERVLEINAEEKPILERCEIYIKFIKMFRRLAIQNIEMAKNRDELITEVRKRCKEDIHYWFTYFAHTYDPRMSEVGLAPKLPFILFPKQKILVDNMAMWYKERTGGLIEKTREEGISWLSMAFMAWNFMWSRGFTGLLASQSEEKVDVLGSRNPLFGKIRYLIYMQPVWLRPTGFENEKNPYDNQRFIKNPDNGNELKGEIGDSIGRSGRCSVLVIDESQDLEHPDRVNDAAESVTNCRIDIGTPNGMNHFWKRRESGILVGSIGWWEDPRKNPLWREGMESGKRNLESPWWKYTEERIKDPIILARNHMIDYNASVIGAFIPAEWVVTAIDFAEPTAEDQDVVAGFDVAGGGENEAVYISRIGICAGKPKISPFKTATDAGWFAIRQGEFDGVNLLNYDADGIGMSLNELYRDSENPIRFKTVGVRSGKAASEKMIEEEGVTCRQKFMNKKAEVWWTLRDRFRKTYEHKSKIKFYRMSELISIPNDDKLLKQLGSPLMVTRSGRIGVESKESMRSRSIPSPDRADALAYCFWDAGDETVMNFNNVSGSKHVTEEKIDRLRAVGDQYVSIFQTKDMLISGLVCLWKFNSKNPELIVYSEHVWPNPTPGQVVEEIGFVANPQLMKIKEWICNDSMINGLENGTNNQWHLYKKQGVTLRKNYTNDFRTSIVMINQMFDKNILRVHTDCTGLLRQLMNWKEIKGGEGNNVYGLVIALCQLVTRLKVRHELTEEMVQSAAYGGFNKRNLAEV